MMFDEYYLYIIGGFIALSVAILVWHIPKWQVKKLTGIEPKERLELEDEIIISFSFKFMTLSSFLCETNYIGGKNMELVKPTWLSFSYFFVLSILFIVIGIINPVAAQQTSGNIRQVCDEAAEMRNNRPFFPTGATDIEEQVDVNEDRGPLSLLYPGIDTTTDDFYPLPCETSIGGTLPPEVDEMPTPDELEAEAYLTNFEQVEGQKMLDEIKVGRMSKLFRFFNFNVEPCFIIVSQQQLPRRRQVPCNSSAFLRSGQPFEGRDIIYVHGLAREHLEKRLAGDRTVRKPWPLEASEFLGSSGYFRKYARDYWRTHIQEHLYDPDNPANPTAGWQWTASDAAPRYNPKSNRYMLVAWSSNQTIEFAQHALLEQIRQAITSNRNVVTPPSYPSSHVRPFCSNGCIIISHSTGGLIVSSAMSLANRGFFGPGARQIPKHIRTHVAFAGAISGSRIASVAMAVAARTSSPVPNSLCLVYNELLNITDSCIQDTKFVAHSILRDLMPVVAQGVWGPVLARSPVPTVTVAGGHPTGNQGGITKILLPGLDDGVVSMNSACGNPNPVFPYVLAPSGAPVTSLLKAFDMSQNSAMRNRGIKNFISHKHLMGGAIPGPLYLASACTPYLSPTGMVMPVASPLIGTMWDARLRYPNHFSFIQGSIDHAYDGGNDPNRWPSVDGHPASHLRQYWHPLGPNLEETSAVTNRAIYRQFPDGTYLVHPAFANMREIVRGRSWTFKLFGKKRRIWVWKRTYHLLDKWEQKQSSHYAYEFVGRR